MFSKCKSQSVLKTFQATLFAIFCLTFAFSLQAKNKVTSLSFNEGDRVMFIGDSITHYGDYHKNIVLFHATRFPNKTLTFSNMGISGNVARDANEGYEKDISQANATVATIMLGMNDIQRHLYEASHNITQAEIDAIQAEYEEQMALLLAKLLDDGVKVILLTPSIFDQTAELDLPKLVGVNDGLAKMGEFLTQHAKNIGVSVVDFQAPMLSVNQAMQQKSPSATIVSKDRIHPQEAGHFLMSHIFLSEQIKDPYVNKLSFDVATKGVVEHRCETLRDLNIQSQSLSFECKARSLPFPLSEVQQNSLQWIDFMARLNQMPLTIKGLKAGNYCLKIDDVEVLKASAKQFSTGIDLAGNVTTPMYQQAIKAKALNDKRAYEDIKTRDILHVEYSILDEYPDLDLNDAKAVKETLTAHVDKSKGKPWYSWLKDQAERYLQHKAYFEQYKANASRLNDELYKLVKPIPHRYEVLPIAQCAE